MDIHEFDEIRPYEKGEMKEALNQLLGDRHFNKMMQGLAPWLPKGLRNGLFRMMFIGVKTPLDFQLRFMKHVVRHVLKKYARGYTFNHETISNRGNQLFISNHRDIVLDSAILDLMLHEAGFPTTCEIAIGDNLLIYPWIKKLVKLNKAFTVRRGLSPRELMESSQLMSRYMHHAINEKKENIWIAQREGRAKDSNDRTQESVLKMLAMGGEGTPAERLKHLHITPLTISYEYDPCDYLKAMEFQQKRDNPSFKKSKQDDLDNMKTGIWGKKGHIHYQTAPCINAWIDTLAHLPKAEFFTAVAQRMDREIHKGYMLFSGNYVALDLLQGNTAHQSHYSQAEKERFEKYIQERIDMIPLPNKDVPFLREKLLAMYANPVINKEKAVG